MPDVPRIEESPGAITFDILVVPRSSRARIGPVVGERIKIAITAAPVEGKANAAVVELVARALSVRRSQVTITAGERSRRKTVRVEGGTRAVLLESLQE